MMTSLVKQKFRPERVFASKRTYGSCRHILIGSTATGLYLEEGSSMYMTSLASVKALSCPNINTADLRKTRAIPPAGGKSVPHASFMMDALRISPPRANIVTSNKKETSNINWRTI